VCYSSGVGIRLLVRLEKSLLDRGSPFSGMCGPRQDLFLLGLRVLKEAKVFLAHFYIVTTVTKTNTDTFSQFLVLNTSCVCVCVLLCFMCVALFH